MPSELGPARATLPTGRDRARSDRDDPLGPTQQPPRVPGDHGEATAEPAKKKAASDASGDAADDDERRRAEEKEARERALRERVRERLKARQAAAAGEPAAKRARDDDDADPDVDAKRPRRDTHPEPVPSRPDDRRAPSHADDPSRAGAGAFDAATEERRRRVEEWRARRREVKETMEEADEATLAATAAKTADAPGGGSTRTGMTTRTTRGRRARSRRGGRRCVGSPRGVHGGERYGDGRGEGGGEAEDGGERGGGAAEEEEKDQEAARASAAAVSPPRLAAARAAAAAAESGEEAEESKKEEEEEEPGAHLPPLRKEPEEEIDPLDAFMAENTAKAEAMLVTSAKPKRADAPKTKAAPAVAGNAAEEAAVVRVSERAGDPENRGRGDQAEGDDETKRAAREKNRHRQAFLRRRFGRGLFVGRRRRRLERL